MAESVLLVHDDIATIATVRRLLAREGYEVILATSVADALIAFGHHLPALMILAPGMEGGRGHLVLDELGQHPDMRLARVLLLGESVPGSAAPMAPLPLDGSGFVEQVTNAIRSPAGPEAWFAVKEEVEVLAPAPVPSGPPGLVHKSSAPGRNAALEHALFDDLPKVEEPKPARSSLDAEDLFSQTEQAVVATVPAPAAGAEAPGPKTPGGTEPDPGAEAESLFGQTEQAVTGSVQVALEAPAGPDEDEMRRMEDEVRREAAARRRMKQEDSSLPESSSAGLFARTPAMGTAIPLITAPTPVELGPVPGLAREPVVPLPRAARAARGEGRRCRGGGPGRGRASRTAGDRSVAGARAGVVGCTGGGVSRRATQEGRTAARGRGFLRRGADPDRARRRSPRPRGTWMARTWSPCQRMRRCRPRATRRKGGRSRSRRAWERTGSTPSPPRRLVPGR